jgi:hypothetical protein
VAFFLIFWRLAAHYQNTCQAKHRVKHFRIFSTGKLVMASGKTDFSLDPVGKHQLDILLVCFVYNSLRTQPAFLLGFFFRQDMIFECALTLNLTGTGHLKALLRPRLGF